MDKVLTDRISPKKKTNGEKPWSFKAPTKDQAHSGCISAGDNYGSGFRQPVGHDKARGLEASPIPQKSVSFTTDKIFYGEDKKG